MDTSEEAVILSVETSSRIGSAALAVGPELLAESQFTGPMQHSSELFPAIEGLLRTHGYLAANIDQVYIAIGPGSFTGLRIAVALAKAMHLANAVRIVTVDSLDVIAANVADAPAGQGPTVSAEAGSAIPERIAALFDAKRGQFYVAIYQRVAPAPTQPPGGDEEGPGYRIPGPGNSLWQKIVPDSLLTIREIAENVAGSDRLGVVGDGLFFHREEFDGARMILLPERYWSPHAANVHRLGYQKARAGRFADPLTLTPFYLRGPEVTLRKKP